MMQGDEISSLSVQHIARKPRRGVLVAKQRKVVALYRVYMTDALARVALPDDVNRMSFDVDKPQAAAEHRFEDAELCSLLDPADTARNGRQVFDARIKARITSESPCATSTLSLE
jgi:hypothetical protein